MKSQTFLILNCLKKGKSITPIEALTEFGCFRLSGRIWDLRNGEFDGVRYPIKMTLKKQNGKTFAEYKL